MRRNNILVAGLVAVMLAFGCSSSRLNNTGSGKSVAPPEGSSSKRWDECVLYYPTTQSADPKGFVYWHASESDPQYHPHINQRNKNPDGLIWYVNNNCDRVYMALGAPEDSAGAERKKLERIR